MRLASPVAVLVALVASVPASGASAAEPSPPEGGDGGSVEVVPITPGDGQPTVEPDPGATSPEPDTGEPVKAPELPPEGLAHRPYLPSVDRDMVSPRAHGAGRGAAQVSLARVGEDLFVDLNLVYAFEVGPWRIAPRLPLRLRVEDEAPETADVIRREDWDEPSDWARLLAFVQYGRHGDPYYFRYGELNGVTVGHGSLVNRYFNGVDIDHYQGGVFAAADLGLVGGQALLDNVLDPELLVGRAYVRPFDLLDWALPARKLKLAVTLGADFTAPLAIDQRHGKLFATPDWTPVVLADEVAGLFAVDLEVPVLSLPHVDVVPYVDVATVDGKGFGVHVGSYLNVRMSPKSSWRTRAEYRFLGEGYEPGYVSPFYEIERYAYGGTSKPKLAALKDGDLGGAHSGLYFESDLRLAGILRYTFIYATSGRDRGRDLLMRLRLPHLGPVRLTLFWARLGFDDFFHSDQTVAGLSARVLFAEHFFVRASLVNEWWLAHGEAEGTHYETTLDFDLGAGVLIKL